MQIKFHDYTNEILESTGNIEWRNAVVASTIFRGVSSITRILSRNYKIIII